MSRSSARRGQVEPAAALVAVLAVGAGLSLYAGVLADVPVSEAPDVAPLAADRVRDATSTAGVLDPGALGAAVERGAPRRSSLNATLSAGGERWSAGPPLPGGALAKSANHATVRASVRLAPGRIRPGQLRVVVW